VGRVDREHAAHTADFHVADVQVSLVGITLPAAGFALSVDRVRNGFTRPFFGWVSDWRCAGLILPVRSQFFDGPAMSVIRSTPHRELAVAMLRRGLIVKNNDPALYLLQKILFGIK